MLLSETMNDTVARIFGNLVSQCIFRGAEKRLALKREEFGLNSSGFYVYLEEIIGWQPALIIQSITLRRLSFKLKREYEEINSHVAVLDKLYEIKFKLLASPGREERPTCN